MDLSLSTEIDEILDGELGSDATLTTASPSGSTSIRCIFYKDFEEQEVLDTDWEDYNTSAKCKTSDVTNAQQNDSLTVDSVAYNIEKIDNDVEGWTTLILSVPNS